MVHFFPR